MRYFRWCLPCLVVLVLTATAITGCGVAQSEYDALLAQKQALENEVDNLQADYDAKKADYDSMKTDYNALIAKSILENDIEALRFDRDATQAKLDDIKKVYPPREFSSRAELEDWLFLNDASEKPASTYVDGWFAKALEIQYEALLDGYIVSADYDYFEEDDTYTVFCTTMIDGYVWYWDPDSDEVASDAYLGKIN